MKIDLYTKVFLTVIDLALVGNLLKPVLKPSTVQAAGEGKFGHVQVLQGFMGLLFFDTKTGDLWLYNGGASPKESKVSRIKIVELGQPLQEIK